MKYILTKNIQKYGISFLWTRMIMDYTIELFVKSKRDNEKSCTEKMNCVGGTSQKSFKHEKDIIWKCIYRHWPFPRQIKWWCAKLLFFSGQLFLLLQFEGVNENWKPFKLVLCDLFSIWTKIDNVNRSISEQI